MTSQIAFERVGSGEPLLLIHGTGLSRKCWQPVTEALAAERDVILVDLPGHGESPCRPDLEPTPRGYAVALGELLDELALARVDVAGNSVGGWTALELAKNDRARSVVALAPAGLWPKTDPFSAVVQLWLDHQLSRLLAPFIPAVLRRPVGRSIFLRGAFAKPRQVPAKAAIAMSRDMASTRGFTSHLRATGKQRFVDGQHLSIPVTVVWGEHERLIPQKGRRRDQLPPTTRWLELPGCGHVMTWDDPALVTQTILGSIKPPNGTGMGRIP